MRLWYKDPARAWQEALPVGNGRLGGMVFGDPMQEMIQLNEDSVWSGKKMDRINPDANKYLPEIRSLIREGKPREAQRLALYALSGTPNSQRSYQTAGEFRIEMHGLKDVVHYERELDLDEGIARVCFVSEDIVYHREVFVSYPDNIMMIHLWTDGEKPFSFDCSLERCHNFQDEVRAEKGDQISFIVNAPDGGVSFGTVIKIKTEGGKTTSIGEYLVAEQVTDAVIALDVETSFREKDYVWAARKRCSDALEKGLDHIRNSHREDYQKLFSRMELHFADTEKEKELIPTNVRLKAVQSGEKDMGLLETYFQFGRYLLMSSSRAGSLPANLQGIWNDSLTPPWDSKFTININTEMNYWIAESGNLSECHLPLFEHLEKMKESGKETARRMYGCRGSVAHHNTDLYADTAPQDHYVPATFWVMGEAWLATHVWEHYLYTNDKVFLEQYFDILEQCVLFFYDFLVEGPDGTLVVSPSLSPENTYRMADGTEGVFCESSTMDVEILTELFKDYVGACKVLELDQERIEKAETVMKRFPAFKIGKYGQLQEWMEDYEEPEPGHRHISHLYGIYPGSSLTEENTPKERKAARVSLERRLENGGGHTGWSRAWIIGLWAAFGEGERAYENLKAILSMGTFPNLMDNHPWKDGYVFQIDGNLGASAAMLEMFAQCREGHLILLPAVTEETGSGFLRGMRIRGGAELSMKWKDKKVIWLRLMPDHLKTERMEMDLQINGKTERIVLNAGQEFIWEK